MILDEIKKKRLIEAEKIRIANQKGDAVFILTKRLYELEDKIDAIKAPEVDLKPLRDELAKLEKKINNIKVIPGDKGDSYILTRADKKEIAETIKVPIVEKVIEKRETIREIPKVTNQIVKEIIKDEQPESLRDKLESLDGDERLDKSAIKGLEPELKKIQDENRGANRPFWGSRGFHLFVDGIKKGLVQFLNIKAGDNITIDYSVQNGLPTTTINASGGSSTDEKVKLSASDPTAGYLDAKIVEGGYLAGYVPYTGAIGDVNLGTHAIIAHAFRADSSDGVRLEASNGTLAALFGAGGGANATFYDGVKLNGGTASRVLVTDSNKNISYSTITDTQLVSAATGSMTFIIGDGDTVITAGTTGYLPQMPYGGTITAWYLTETSSTPVAGSIVIDVWKDTTGNYPPTVLDTIAGSEKPTLSSATNNKDETLTTWTTTVTAGDCLGFKVDSVTDCKKVTLIIKFNKS